MVKLKGPALSTHASGTLADILTFGTSKKRNTLRKKPTPKQPRSGLQVSMRAMMKFLSQEWTNISTSDKATWANAYPDPQLNDYNSYLSYNLQRWRSLRAPTKAFPATQTGLFGYTHALWVVGGVRHTLCATRFDTDPRDAWTGFLYHKYGSPPTMGVDTMIHVYKIEDTAAHYWTHTPLQTGQHYYVMTQGLATGLHYTSAQPSDNEPVT